MPDPKHSGEKYKLSHIVNEIKNKKIINLIGLGLGSNTEHVSNYYPISLPNITAKDLPIVFAELLEQIIRHPEKFSSKTGGNS